MHSIDRLTRFWFLTAILVGGGGLATAQPDKPLPEGYAGSETCQVCHEDIYKAFAKNPHHAAEKGVRRTRQVRTSAEPTVGALACESCHGPGQMHAESADASKIRNPATLSASETDQTCLTCHLNQPTHAGRLQSSHARDQVACTSCHKMHASGAETLVARSTPAINQQCASCHTSVWAQFQKPSHHKLPEGAMTCVDCHNPHGSQRPAMQQTFAANEPGCLNCHGDKRGPFTYEHGPVRFEGCSTCHEPHGSANPRMLTRQEVRLQCLECHASLPTVPVSGVIGVVPPSFHDLRSPRYQNCTVCHQKIHGSYVDRNLLR